MTSFLGGEAPLRGEELGCVQVIVKDVSNFRCIRIVMRDNLRACGVAKCFG